MRFVNAARTISSFVIVLAFLIQPALAETSIGFENPDDTSNILEYRLPVIVCTIYDQMCNLSLQNCDFLVRSVSKCPHYHLYPIGFFSFSIYLET